MTPEQIALWQRLEGFRVDDGSESLTFVRRLARENGWSAGYARRVCAEYRRFAFLAMEAGHPVTPSDQVDQAWHLHLTYTRSYWEVFCGTVLGRPLHHEPTRGGRHERAKFRDWYARTLASYRRLFGEEPPADVWPEPSVRFGEAPYFRRVNTKRHWLVPKPRPRAAAVAAGAAFLALGAGCAAGPALEGGGGVFGLGFFGLLGLYLSAFLAGLGLAWMVRKALKTAPTIDRNDDDPEPDRYELAYLAGREQQVFAAAVVRLVETGVLAYDQEKDVVTFAGPLPADAPEPERLVHERVARSEAGIHVGQLRRDVWDEIGLGYESLADRGLMLEPSRANVARVASLLTAVAVPNVAFILCVVGLVQGASLEVLLPLLFVTMLTELLATVAFIRRPIRTPAGDRALARGRERLASREWDRDATPGGKPELSDAILLFGLGALNATMFARMADDLSSAESPAGRRDDELPDVNDPGEVGDPGTADAGCGADCGGCGD